MSGAAIAPGLAGTPPSPAAATGPASALDILGAAAGGGSAPVPAAPKPATPPRALEPIRPPKAEITAQGPVGLWLRYGPQTNGVGTEGGVAHGFVSAWYFAPDGAAYAGVRAGIAPADLASTTQGKLSMSAKGMSVRWSDGEVVESPIERDAEGAFMWNMGSFTPLKPVRAASALVGRWDVERYLQRETHGSQLQIMQTWTFAADGTFSVQSVGAVLEFNGDTESPIQASAEVVLRGRWTLDGWSLALTSDAGHVIDGLAYTMDDGPTHRVFHHGVQYTQVP